MPARDEPDLDPALADAVRRAYVRPVDEVVATRHVNAMVAEADAGAAPAPVRRARPARRAWPTVLGAGVVATLLLPVGLAAAGVSLPRAVEEPYRAVGITLPNQTAEAPATPVTPRVPATTTAPARPAARRPGSSSKTSSTPRRPTGSGSSSTSSRPGVSKRPGAAGRPSTPAQPSTSRRPATPPGAGSSASGSKANGLSRRPVVSPKKRVVAKPAKPKPAKPAKPVTPTKPATPQSKRPSPADRGPSTVPGAASPQNGNRQPKAG